MILLGATDVGPAKYLVQLGKIIQRPLCYRSGPLAQYLFEERGIVPFSEVDSQQVDLVITGTALGDCLDKALVTWARKEGIKSISVIEHWSWYRKRFLLDGDWVLPDAIFVNDQYALEAARKEGLPEDRLVIMGNPLLESVAVRYQADQLDQDSLRQKHGVSGGRTILFVSEQLAKDFNGTEDELGYDEYSVLDSLMELLGQEDQLLIKLHPEEPADKYDYLERDNVTVLGAVTLPEMNALADVVIGMGSMLLLELAMLRDDIISFRPNNRKAFIGGEVNATLDLDSIEQLRQQLKQPRFTSGAFRQSFVGSAKKISRYIEELVP